MLATLTRDYFSDPGWIFEPKLDGTRMLAWCRAGETGLFTRNRRRQNEAFPDVIEALEKLAARSFVADGELLCPTLAGGKTGPAEYVIFDLLYFEGEDVRALPLHERKAILAQNFPAQGQVRRIDFRREHGVAFMEEACARGWEGLIAKRLDSPYVGGKSADWLKFKCLERQEFVIGGYTSPQGQRAGFGSLLLGLYEGSRLCYAGRVGTGFTVEVLEAVHRKLKPLAASESPFADAPNEPGVHWVRPELICECVFSAWTPAGKLRHPRFMGLRDDKDAREVVREQVSA